MSERLELSPSEARLKLSSESSRALLIDVREPEKLRLASIEGAVPMPMRTVPAQLQKLETMADQQELLVICHHGVRSLQVVCWLREQGIENCGSVAGGIDRWSLEVDSTVPRY